MSANISAKNPIIIEPKKKAELNRLTNPGKFCWPTIALLFYIVCGVITVDVIAVKGIIPLWAGMLLNLLAMWPVFHVAHDALHRAASSNQRLNDLIGSLALLMVIPQLPLGVFRYSHMLHHRFTNDPARDPDLYMSGKWWTMPFRWNTYDLYYVWNNWRSNDPRGRQTVRAIIPNLIATLAVVGVLIHFGYGTEVLMLWFLPQRLTFLGIGLVFLWMPHVVRDENGKMGHITTASPGDNLTAGTTMRLGAEGLFNVLMQWHNYHLIHHLWPTTPSYNHRKVWLLLEPELRARDLRIQHGFDLLPQFYPGGSTTPAST